MVVWQYEIGTVHGVNVLSQDCIYQFLNVLYLRTYSLPLNLRRR
jgi:hypothetical protein